MNLYFFSGMYSRHGGENWATDAQCRDVEHEKMGFECCDGCFKWFRTDEMRAKGLHFHSYRAWPEMYTEKCNHALRILTKKLLCFRVVGLLSVLGLERVLKALFRESLSAEAGASRTLTGATINIANSIVGRGELATATTAPMVNSLGYGHVNTDASLCPSRKPRRVAKRWGCPCVGGTCEARVVIMTERMFGLTKHAQSKWWYIQMEPLAPILRSSASSTPSR